MSAIGKSGNESTYYFNTDTYLLDKLENNGNCEINLQNKKGEKIIVRKKWDIRLAFLLKKLPKIALRVILIADEALSEEVFLAVLYSSNLSVNWKKNKAVLNW